MVISASEMYELDEILPLQTEDVGPNLTAARFPMAFYVSHISWLATLQLSLDLQRRTEEITIHEHVDQRGFQTFETEAPY